MAVGCLAGVLSSGVAEDPIVTQWVARTVAAGGSVAASTRSLADDYVKGCKADGYWNTLANGLILPFASDGFAGFSVPLIVPSGGVITNQNFVMTDYSLNRGVDPGLNNATKQLVTNIQVQTLFTSTNVQITAYKRSTRIPSNASSIILSANNSNNSARLLLVDSPLNTTSAAFDSFDLTQGNNGATGGRLFVDNNNSGNVKTPLGVSSARLLSGRRSWLFAGVERGFNTSTGGTFPATSPVYIMGADNANRCSNVMSYLYAGRALTNAQELQHVARVNTLQAGLGRAV
jgi:hypothetical protein